MLCRAVGSYKNLGKCLTITEIHFPLKGTGFAILIELESGGEGAVLTPRPPSSTGPAVVVLAWFGESSKSRSILHSSRFDISWSREEGLIVVTRLACPCLLSLLGGVLGSSA